MELISPGRDHDAPLTPISTSRTGWRKSFSPHECRRLSPKRHSMDCSDSKSRNITVAIRIRPLVKSEPESDELWTFTEAVPGHSIQERHSGDTYGPFDHVFGPAACTSEIFARLAQDVVKSAFDGINGTVFAYGQTSSGKTFTMMGSTDEPGIVPLSIQELFRLIDARKIQGECTSMVAVSYLEIYNEQVVDLLEDARQPCEIRLLEDASGQLRLTPLQQPQATSAAEVLRHFARGEARRRVGQTRMNDHSSRSHAILQVMLESTGFGDGVRTSQLNLVDLAGSEGLRHTGSSGERRREGSNINKSLLALSQVISALGSSVARQHVNFRDSKLTRILQASLGGNAQTTVICTASPAQCNVGETKSTLQFAMHARHVQNRVRVNVCNDEQSVIRGLQLQVEQLRRELERRSSEEALREQNLDLRSERHRLELRLLQLSEPSEPSGLPASQESCFLQRVVGAADSLDSLREDLASLVQALPECALPPEQPSLEDSQALLLLRWIASKERQSSLSALISRASVDDSLVKLACLANDAPNSPDAAVCASAAIGEHDVLSAESVECDIVAEKRRHVSLSMQLKCMMQDENDDDTSDQKSSAQNRRTASDFSCHHRSVGAESVATSRQSLINRLESAKVELLQLEAAVDAAADAKEDAANDLCIGMTADFEAAGDLVRRNSEHSMQCYQGQRTASCEVHAQEFVYAADKSDEDNMAAVQRERSILQQHVALRESARQQKETSLLSCRTARDRIASLRAAHQTQSVVLPGGRDASPAESELTQELEETRSAHVARRRLVWEEKQRLTESQVRCDRLKHTLRKLRSRNEDLECLAAKPGPLDTEQQLQRALQLREHLRGTLVETQSKSNRAVALEVETAKMRAAVERLEGLTSSLLMPAHS